MFAANHQRSLLAIMVAYFDPAKGITGPTWSPYAKTIFNAYDRKMHKMWCLQAFQNQMETLGDDTNFLYHACNLPTFGPLAIGYWT